MNYCVYILRCSNGNYYVGSTKNLDERVKAHNDGKGSDFTRLRRPVTLVFSEPCESEAAAVQRERQIKKWSRAKKEALIIGDTHAMHRLSRRQT